jgi:uncharacterized protein (DUF2252 family)
MPPLVYHGDWTPDQYENVLLLFEQYRATLLDDRKAILDRYRLVDIAVKVVGIGSVGTRCFVLPLLAEDGDPLILQVKEARHSVLEPFAGAGPYREQGRRVVEGQRLIQTASDIFLGWMRGVQEDRYYCWRQLRDMKGSALVEQQSPLAMNYYAGACGWTLARAHARSGDPAAIAAYLGTSDTFDRAMGDFAERYADQNERDYEAFVGAVRAGTLEAIEGV